MISSTKKFIFIHIPKTGGNSIQNALKPYADDTVSTHEPNQDGVERYQLINPKFKTTKHSTLSDYKKNINKKDFNNLLKVAVIRNPWDRAISHYFSPYREITKWDRSDFLNFLPEIKPLSHYITTKKGLLTRILSRKDQNNVALSLDSEIDFLIRFENLSNDFAKFCGLVGIPKQELIKRNASPRDHYSRYYDSELVEIVGNYFKDEIIYGCYTFEKSNL